MSFEFYKLIHMIGLFLLVSGLIGILTITWNGQALVGKVKTFSFMTHGLGLLFLLLGGFGMLAKMGIMSAMPAWVYGKIIIWLFFGASVTLLKRKGHIGWPMYAVLFLVFVAAAYLGVFKPA